MGTFFSRPADGHVQPHGEAPRTLIDKTLYEFHNPKEQADIQIVFFHGMEEKDSSQSFAETWRSHDRCTFWPKSLLAEQFSMARILTVRYDSSLTKTRTEGRLDLYRTAENFIQVLPSDVGVVQNDCPIILVGKDLGCLVIEAICVHAKNARNDDCNKFLNNIRGLFFYSPATMGIKRFSRTFNGEMAQKLRFNDKEISRLNQEFFDLKDMKEWKVRVLIPSNKTTGKAIGGVDELDEASSLYGSDNLMSVEEDMNTICTPNDSTSQSFIYLKDFISPVLKGDLR